MNTEKGGYRIDEALAAVDEASPGAVVMSRRSFAKFGAAVAAAAAMGTLGTYAFFTGTDRKENQVSVADNLNVKVVEPAWDPEASKNVVPGQHVPKDPRIRNLHDAIDGYLFVEIRVPTAVVSVYDPQTQTVLPAARTPLFSFDASEEWVVLQTFDDGDDVVWRFGWPEPIGPKSDTPPIFEEVVVANLAEEQGQAGKHVVGVTGYGIQSTGFSNCQNAWDAYKRQNGIGDGAPPAGVSAVTAGTLLKFVADTPPEVGDTLDGAEVTCVVPDVETGAAGCLSDTPGAIERVECLVPTAPEDTSDWFKDMSSCEAMDLSGLDTAGIKDSAGMFAGTTKLVEVTMSPAANPSILPEGFKATDGQIVYKRGSEVYAITLAAGSTREIVIDRLADPPARGDMFLGRSVTAVHPGVETWGEAMPPWSSDGVFSSVEIRCNISPLSIASWFASSFLTSVTGLEKIDASNVTNMSAAFSDTWNLSHLDGIEGWDTSKVADMSYMFRGSGLTGLDVSRWNMSSVTTMERMFENCSSLEYVEASGCDVGNVVNMSRVFSNCQGMKRLGATGWAATSVTDMTEAFYCCTLLEDADLADLDLSSLEKADNMFMGCSSIKRIDAERWNTGRIKSMEGMFASCSSLEYLPVGRWDTSMVESMTNMFGGCSTIKALTTAGWDTSSVTAMGGMFGNCNSLAEAEVAGWDTSHVESMSGMFGDCHSIKTAPVSQWDTSKVTDMSYMFGTCIALESLPAEGWDTSNVTNMSRMFESVEKQVCDFSSWDVRNVTSHEGFNAYAFVMTEPTWAA